MGTAIISVTLSGSIYRRAHDPAQSTAILWNQAIDWVHSGRSPGISDIQKFLTSLPRDERPLHAHSTISIAKDLHEAITTSRTNRKNGIKARAPWRKKNSTGRSPSLGTSAGRCRRTSCISLSDEAGPALPFQYLKSWIPKLKSRSRLKAGVRSSFVGI
jgi:hypothetical protein